MRKFTIKIRLLLITVFLVAVLISAVGLILTDRKFDISAVSVYGLSSVTPDEMLGEIEGSIGQNIILYKTSELKEALKSIPEIAKVKVKRVFPDRIDVFVNEYKPILLINLDKIYGLSDSLVLIPYDDPMRIPDLPVINGLKEIDPLPYMPVRDEMLTKLVEWYVKTNDLCPEFIEGVSELTIKDKIICAYLLPDALPFIINPECDPLVNERQLKYVLNEINKERSEVCKIDMVEKGCAIISYRKNLKGNSKGV